MCAMQIHTGSVIRRSYDLLLTCFSPIEAERLFLLSRDSPESLIEQVLPLHGLPLLTVKEEAGVISSKQVGKKQLSIPKIR